MQEELTDGQLTTLANKFIIMHNIASIMHSKPFMWLFAIITTLFFASNIYSLFSDSENLPFGLVFCTIDNTLKESSSSTHLTMLYLIAPLVTLLFTQSKEAIRNFVTKLGKDNDDKGTGLEYEKFLSSAFVKNILSQEHNKKCLPECDIDHSKTKYLVIKDSIDAMIERKNFFIKLIPFVTALTTLLILSGTVFSIFPAGSTFFKVSIIMLVAAYLVIFTLGFYFLKSIVRMYLFEQLITKSVKYAKKENTVI